MAYSPPGSKGAQKMLLLGAGELGKEIVIEAQRLGVETIAVDRYAGAPGMQVAHRSHVINMLDPDALKALIRDESPDLVVPEIEAIATPALQELEAEGLRVIPTARAARLTMDREGIRRFAAEELGVPTAGYQFANNWAELEDAARALGFPVVVKPLMSSSGKGQSIAHNPGELRQAWDYALSGGRVQNTRVIAEEFIPFDFEITLLTVRTVSGTLFCPPIGHVQKSGDYVESWQPQFLSPLVQEKAESIARAVTDALGGLGIFGVELFVQGDQVYFSEVSPRPHDTGLVTLASQNLSEFALHVRAILGFPIPEIVMSRPSASRAIKSPIAGLYRIDGIGEALAVPMTQVRIFGKPESTLGRRLGVVLSSGDTVEEARDRAQRALSQLSIHP